MKDNDINVFLDISKEINNCKLKQLTTKENNQLSKIIGVFLDNAKEAAQVSVKKEVSVCAYIDKEDVVFFHENVRIRRYNENYSFIKLENKRKYGDKQIKDSITITAEEAQKLSDGDFSFVC